MCSMGWEAGQADRLQELVQSQTIRLKNRLPERLSDAELAQQELFDFTLSRRL